MQTARMCRIAVRVAPAVPLLARLAPPGRAAHLFSAGGDRNHSRPLATQPSNHHNEHGSNSKHPADNSAFFLSMSLIFAAGLGSAAYYYNAARSSDSHPPPQPSPSSVPQANPSLIQDESRTLELNLSPIDPETFVVFVLGGPGAGKGTQCARLVNDFGFVHLSAGDLLREERSRPGSPFGDLINYYIKEGKIVPKEITIALLHAAMQGSGSKRFLIDGFPRQMDQALKFEELICKSRMVLYFECPEEEMLKRLLKRGETSGRLDDNVESIMKRFKTFHETSFPVIKYYDSLGKVEKANILFDRVL